jgi:transglutaminase-like putative cysteine protease
MNPFSQYRTDGYHKPYRGIPIDRLEEFKQFRREVQASTADSQGRTAKVNWRYVFRGPRGRNMFGDCDSFTPKRNAHSFDVYHR